MLQLAGWNIHGFHVDKMIEVLANNNYDIFGIVESWTSGESNISLPGYSHITVHDTKAKGKRGRRSRGIIVYYKKEFSSLNIISKVITTKDYIWIKLNKIP